MSISRAKRWRVQYPVQLAHHSFFDEVETTDVSLHGLSIATSRSIPRGTQLYVRLLLPDRQAAVDYEICTVRWTKGGRIGLEAYQLNAQEEQRLRKHLPFLAGSPEPTGRRNLPSNAADEPIKRISHPMDLFWQVFRKPLTALQLLSHPSSSSRGHGSAH